MKIFSKASQHVIRGMMHALESESLPSFSTKEVCVQASIPEAYARKALQEMTKAGILKGVPGPGGGYRFVREPSEISLLDIILAVDGPNAFAECPMGLRCGLSHLCPMHDLWKETRQVAIRHLQETTLQDIKDRLEGSALVKP
jgi:Rrf2 family protein